MTRISPRAFDNLRERVRRRASVAPGAAWMLLAYSARLGSQAAYYVVLARALSAGGMGAFASALAVVSIFAPFAGLGTGNVLVMRVSRDRGALRSELANAVSMLVLTGVLLTGLATAAHVVVFRNTDAVVPVVALGLAELLSARMVDLGGQVFQACDRLGRNARLVVADSVLRLSAVTIFALGGGHSADAWAYWYAGSSLTAGVISLLACRSVAGPLRLVRPDFSASREGIYFSLGIASRSVYSDVDKVMLARLASVDASGIYAAAYRVLTIAFTPIQTLVYSSNTHLFREGASGPRSVLRFAGRALWPVALYACAAAAALYVLAPLVPLVLGPSFAGSVGALRWLAAMPVVQGIHYLFGDALMGAGRQSARSLLQLATAGLNVALNLWLIPALAWKGAAIASLVSESLLAAGTVWVLVRLARLDTRHGPTRACGAEVLPADAALVVRAAS